MLFISLMDEELLSTLLLTTEPDVFPHTLTHQ